MPPLEPRALVFDVFGTCVDWRGSIIAEDPSLDARSETSTDWAALADAWRGRYQPALEEVRLRPEETMMVDAHYADLRAAAACGLRTADVHRPREFGERPKNDLPPNPDVDLVAKDFEDLASQLGC